MSAAYASDGSSSTETEDEASYEQFIKPESTADTLVPPEPTTEVQELTETLAVKSEPEDVVSSVTEDGNLKLELKPEPATAVPVLTQNSTMKSEPEAVKSVVKTEVVESMVKFETEFVAKTESGVTQDERLEVKPEAQLLPQRKLRVSQSQVSTLRAAPRAGIRSLKCRKKSF